MARKSKTYRVVGPLRVCDTQPGATFTAVLDSGQEEFLLAVGHIAVVPDNARATNAGASKAGAGEKEKA